MTTILRNVGPNQQNLNLIPVYV